MDALIHIAGTVIAGITWIPIGRKNVAKWEHHDLRNIVQLVTVQIGVKDRRVVGGRDSGDAAMIVQPSDTRRLRTRRSHRSGSLLVLLERCSGAASDTHSWYGRHRDSTTGLVSQHHPPEHSCSTLALLCPGEYAEHVGLRRQ